MKFSTKVFVLFAIPTALFAAALATSIGSLVRTQSAFNHYIGTEQAVKEGLTEMYAQGLQMGQALRNVVLDPSNPKAMENLKAAQTAYASAYSRTQDIAKGTSFEAMLQRLPALREAHANKQDEVLAHLADSTNAIATLNSAETPAWRALRAELLAQGQQADALAQQAHDGVTQTTQFAIRLSIAISVLAGAVGIALSVLLRATVRRELGGEPEDVRAALSRVAQGKLDSNIVNRGAPDSLMGAMEAMQLSLRKLVSGVRQAATGIDSATHEIAGGSQDLSNRTETQASALQQTASSMEQLGSTVRSNADSAVQANQLAIDASQVAERGGQVVDQAVKTMQGISDSSRKIADIIGVIDGIAFQTNILALNAAVEAARAGEQGRGFAVVASEVRSLAGRSAAAAREIKVLIGTSVERVELGSTLVNQAGSTMADVVRSIQRVADIVGSIRVATQEQARGVDQVGKAVNMMDSTTQQNAALVEEMAAAAGNLNAQANELVRAVAIFDGI